MTAAPGRSLQKFALQTRSLGDPIEPFTAKDDGPVDEDFAFDAGRGDRLVRLMHEMTRFVGGTGGGKDEGGLIARARTKEGS